MKVSLLVFLLVAPLVVGCDVIAVNPLACKLKDPGFCGAGMYCDQVRNACLPGSAPADGGTDLGSGGYVPTCNDKNFCVVVPPGAVGTGALTGVYGSSATDVWAVGDAGTMLHWNGTAWQSVTKVTNLALHGVWGSATDNFYAVGDGGLILHWDGKAWTPQTSNVTVALRAISGLGTSYVWAVGDGGTRLLSTDGNTWMMKKLGTDLYGVWLDAAGQLMIEVGANSTIDIAAVDSGSLTMSTNGFPNAKMTAVSGFATGKFWAVGEDGRARTLQGGNFTATAASSQPLNGVWVYDTGGNPAGGWAVGSNGTVVSLNASTQQWVNTASGVSSALYAVWGSSGTDIWMVGEQGIILHYPGLP